MPENGKTWFRLRWRTLFMLVLVGLVGWSAYSYWSEYSELAARKAREMMAPSVGAQCTVIFRKDELGLNTSHLDGLVVSGVTNYVQGKFVKLNDEWIVLTSRAEKQIWIPRDHVFLMRVEP